MLLFARCTALDRRFVFSLHVAGMSPKIVIAGSVSFSWQCFTTDSTANALAISPWASPPMPSERTNRFRGSTIRKQSSLFVRTRPTFVTPPLTISTEAPLAFLRAAPTDYPHPCLATCRHAKGYERPKVNVAVNAAYQLDRAWSWTPKTDAQNGRPKRTPKTDAQNG